MPSIKQDLEINPEYVLLTTMVKEHTKSSIEASESINKFRQMIKKHLDPRDAHLDLENTKIHLADFDERLHPQIQEYLTTYYAMNQKANQLFMQISQTLFDIHRKFPEMTPLEFDDHFRNQDIPIYITPVEQMDSKMTDQCDFIWGDQKQKYQLFVTVTSSKKYLQDKLLEYGYESLKESRQHLNQCGFAVMKSPVPESPVPESPVPESPVPEDSENPVSNNPENPVLDNQTS